MSKVRIEVSGIVILDVEDISEAREAGIFLKDTLDNIHSDKFSVAAFDYDSGRKVSLERFKKVVAYSGRQESEGLIQGIIRMLVQGKFVDSAVTNNVAQISEASLKLDELTRHYSVDYGKLHDEVLSFAFDSDTFASSFKQVLSEVLLNNAAGGSSFMKKAKNS